MDLKFSDEDERFRLEIRQALKGMVPSDMARRTRQGVHPTKADLKAWNRIMYERGWAAAHWPKEYGGTGWSPLHVHIFEEECAAADAPFLSYFGLRLVGPLIFTFGTDEQKKTYIPDILTGDTFWCQGFSEPSSGSDLASLRTTAVRQGEYYVINGQKIWTTEAHYADKMFCLVRTNTEVPPQKGGLSFLMLPMDDPGIHVRPIITIDEGHSVNEVFFENVRVPATNIIGEEGRGWDYAKFLLGNERVTNAHVPRAKRDLALLKQMADAGAHPADAEIRRRLAQLEIDLDGLEWSVLREVIGGSRIPAVASALKIVASELQQRMADLAVDLLGPRGRIFYDEGDLERNDLPASPPDYAPGLAARHLFLRATTIYAGSNEIQRGIIAKQQFGL
ncbi:MAG TPA: acyl-CoA dehydrogenase family protein [Caulobacterales bacterium]|nr:acyl-CoA dehydrogenase family protein [Caulobacterales bacterium]